MIMSSKEIVKALRRGLFSNTLLQIAANKIEELESEINHQQAEIERLQKVVNLVSIQFQDLQERYELALIEIERLRKEVNLVSIQFQDLQERYEEAHAEIEQWKEEANKYQNLWCIAVDDIGTAKAEAIKEFAKKHREMMLLFCDGDDKISLKVCEYDANTNDLVKEMAGEIDE